MTVWNHDVPGDLPFTEYLVSVLNKLGFRAHERVVPASDYWSTLSDPSTKAQIGFANWLQDYPHPLDWFGVLLDGRQTTSRAERQLRVFRRAGGDAADRVAHAAAEPHAPCQRAMAAPRSQSDATRSVGAVPQPRERRLLQRPCAIAVLREQRPVRLRLRVDLRQEVTIAYPRSGIGGKAQGGSRRYGLRWTPLSAKRFSAAI